MTRVFNFAAGPAMMPRPVLERAQEELLDWQGQGLSPWELPFTGAEFRDILARAKASLGELLALPPGYRVLFLQGGASLQFSLVPLNLLRGATSANYVETGHWSRKAIIEARRYAQVHVAASSAGSGFDRIPDFDTWQLDPAGAYCHITANETADGAEFRWTPDVGDMPLIADMTSSFLSRPIDVSRYGMIYAGAQKNIGPAGLTVVIVREDLLGRAAPATPTACDYAVQAEHDSRFNTPLTYAIYLAGLVFDWLLARGGLAAVAQANARKSACLYAAIDASDGFYHCPVQPASRSRMNVCFRLPNEELTLRFLQQAEERGLINLRGHGARGGVRASLYNAMPEEGVEALVAFMRGFVADYTVGIDRTDAVAARG
jgi:phosphoserine aminotransferase